jgi:hypothetical protein
MMVLIHAMIRQYSSSIANIVETVSLISLMILSSFNVVASSHVTGGTDPSNSLLDNITAVVMIAPFLVACILFIYQKCYELEHPIKSNNAKDDEMRSSSDSRVISSLAASLINGRSMPLAIASATIIQNDTISQPNDVQPVVAVMSSIVDPHANSMNADDIKRS